MAPSDRGVVAGVPISDRTQDKAGGERAIDMPMDVLLGKPPKMHRVVERVQWGDTNYPSVLMRRALGPA